jgi:ELWxxDGT repeat protein
LVKDINPGSASASPNHLTDVNGTLFFVANDGTDGIELWKSDGTSAGTVLVDDINPGSAPSNGLSLVNVNGMLFFLATDGTHGYEEWKSDGTTAGTTMIKDINPGSGSSVNVGFGPTVNYGTNVNGTLYFQATDGSSGLELWKSDGTAAGTVRVMDINPGSNGSSPANLANINGTLYFAANDGVHGVEPWILGQGPSFSLQGPAASTAGSSFTLTVTALDASGNLNPNYTGAVHFTSSDPSAILPADYTFTAADQGVHTFTITLDKAGAQSVTVVDKSNSSIGGNTSVSVSAAAASSFTATGFPSSTTAGNAGNVTITALDAYGNVATGYTGTVHFTSSDAQAALPADYTFTSGDAGVHVFSATLKTAGTQSITATDTANSSLTSTDAGILVNAAAASVLVVTGPSSVTAGVAFSITVTAKDAYGNVAASYRGTVHFTSTDPKAKLPANYTFTAADNGTHTFSGLILKTKGNQTITITDTANSMIWVSILLNVK